MALATPPYRFYGVSAARPNPLVHLGQLEFPQAADPVRRQPPRVYPTVYRILGYSEVLGDVIHRRPRLCGHPVCVAGCAHDPPCGTLPRPSFVNKTGLKPTRTKVREGSTGGPRRSPRGGLPAIRQTPADSEHHVTAASSQNDHSPSPRASSRRDGLSVAAPTPGKMGATARESGPSGADGARQRHSATIKTAVSCRASGHAP